MPYFVHKEDVDDYDKQREELEPLRKKLRGCGYQSEEYRKLEDMLKPLFDEIFKKYKFIRTKTMFDSINEKDYIPYFMGVRMEGEFAEKMLGIAEDGIDKCKKAIKR